jgi:hypothetical protein
MNGIKTDSRLQSLHVRLHLVDHVVGHLEVVVGPPARKLEEPDGLEVVAEVGLLLVEVADSLPEFADFQSLQRSHLYVCMYVCMYVGACSIRANTHLKASQVFLHGSVIHLQAFFISFSTVFSDTSYT